MSGPMCCGMPAYKNVVSPTLEFWVCKECKREVLDLPPPPPAEVDEYEGWPIGLMQYRVPVSGWYLVNGEYKELLSGDPLPKEYRDGRV